MDKVIIELIKKHKSDYKDYKGVFFLDDVVDEYLKTGNESMVKFMDSFQDLLSKDRIESLENYVVGMYMLKEDE